MGEARVFRQQQELWDKTVDPLSPRRQLMDSKIEARLKKLVTMTSSSHEEEARTAALMACKLIQEHRLLDQLVATGRLVELEHDAAAWRSHCARRQQEPTVVARYRSKYACTCRTCGAPIAVGALIAWHGRGKGSSCARHYPE